MCDVVKRYAADEVREVTEKYSAIIAQKEASLAQMGESMAQKDSQIADLMRQLHEAQQKNQESAD